MKNFKILFWISFFIFCMGFVSSVPLTGVLKDGSDIVEPPEQMLNFSLELEKKEIYRIWDFSFKIKIETLLEEKTNLILSYLVLDSEGNLVYFDEEEVIIFEDSILEKNLDTLKAQELDLESGEYAFILRFFSKGVEGSLRENFKINKISDSLYPLKQLFDIKMQLEESLIYGSEDLFVMVFFESFGEEPTPANLTFMIFNEEGGEVYRKDISIIVETERVVLENFEGIDLDYGNYKLILRTLYNVDVVDYFEQYFEIRKKQDYWFLIIFGAIFLLGVYYVFREMRKNNSKRKRRW